MPTEGQRYINCRCGHHLALEADGRTLVYEELGDEIFFTLTGTGLSRSLLEEVAEELAGARDMDEVAEPASPTSLLSSAELLRQVQEASVASGTESDSTSAAWHQAAATWALAANVAALREMIEERLGGHTAESALEQLRFAVVEAAGEVRRG